MPSVKVHNDAVRDLKAIRAEDELAFGRLYALIEQLKSDPAWVHRLLDHGHGDDRLGDLSVSKWISAWRVHVPVWRLKFWDLEREGLRYRILYYYYYRDQSYNIMAVVAREEFDYDNPADPIRQRVLAACRREFPGG